MQVSMFLSLDDSVSISKAGSGFVLESSTTRLTFTGIPEGIRTAFEQLVSTSGEYEDRLWEQIEKSDGIEVSTKFYYYLQKLFQRGLLRCSAKTRDICLATMKSTSPNCVYASRLLQTEQPYVLSRFAYVRREGTESLLESPLGSARVTLHDWRAAAIVHALAHPGDLSDLSKRVPQDARETLPALVTLLLSSNMVHQAEAGDASPDELALQTWEFHDLLFHARSRMGRHGAPVGGTFRFAGKSDPPPALKSPMSKDTVDLYRPDLSRLKLEDPPLTRVQEDRQSIRRYGATPLNVRQLGEFLFRVGRVKEVSQLEIESPSGKTLSMDFAYRPFPSGGALYELEFYVIANACCDLARGLYRYDPLNHRLERLTDLAPDVDQLLEDASGATRIPKEELQVLIVIAARFQRMAWKYATMAYSVVLKHVGVVYHSMYLAATAMGLAPCAVGDGDSDCFARAAGLNYYCETSVGEFLLASRRLP